MTLQQHICVPGERECNVRKLSVLREKIQQLRALNKPLFTTVSPYKSDSATLDEDADSGNILVDT